MNKILETKYNNIVFINTQKEKFTIIEYFTAKNVTIKFEDGTIKNNVAIGNINLGKVSNPNYKRLMLGIGIIGVGKYTSTNNKFYQIWTNIFQRCYGEENKKHPTYINCSIDSIWHNFQNFAEWCEKNYIIGFNIDKDILIKGNKIYGPNTCCFVPKEINVIFTKTNALRGKYPIGVQLCDSKYRSIVSINGEDKHLGYFNTPEEAFQAYKIAKERYIKWIALTWKNKISQKVFNALTNYIVEITD